MRPSGPSCLEHSSPDPSLRLDVEDVGEVALDTDLEVTDHGLTPPVGEVVVLVDALAHDTVHPEVKGVLVDGAPIGPEHPGVGQLESSRMVAGGRSVQEHWIGTAERYPESGDEPGVGDEIAVLVTVRHLS